MEKYLTATTTTGIPTAPAQADQAQKVDARPILHRTEDNIWVRASQLRDTLYDAVSQGCACEGIDALVLKSGPFVHPAWVQFEAWVPADGTANVTDRISATVAIHPRPYHSYEFAYALETRGREDVDKKKSRLLTKFGAEEARQVVRFLLRREPKPHFLDLEFREKWYQFWKPKNRVVALRRDGAQILVVVLFIVGILTFAIGIGVLVTIAAIILQRRLAKRPRLVRAAGKPKGEPRNLVRVDSWQAMIFGAGDGQASLREQFLKLLESPPNDKFRSRVERIWHWGLDGKE